MKKQQKKKLIFNATIEVNVESLTETFLENTELDEADSVKGMIFHEFNWVVDSGIELLELKQVK